jgi:hypothetical protein
MVEVCSPARILAARLLVLLISAGCCAAATPAHAQAVSSAPSLAGDVIDSDGRAVVDAALVIRHEATNEIRTTSTDANGHFAVSGLAAGAHTTRCVAARSSRRAGFGSRSTT